MWIFELLWKKVQIVDLDSLKVSWNYVNNCKNEGRIVSTSLNPDFQIIDTVGVLSGSISHYLKKSDTILVPFRPHYIDLLVIIPWFSKLSTDLQKKVLFLPNFWRNTKEQKEGLKELNSLIEKKQAGNILPPIPDKPASYGTIVNGFSANFFEKHKDKVLIDIFKQIISNT